MKRDKLLTVVLLILAATLGSAQEKFPSVDEIVNRHIDALGGADKIAGIRATFVHGTYREGRFEMPHAFMAKMRPYYKTLADPKNLEVDVNEGYDGSAWEYYKDPGIVLRTVGAAAASTRHGTEIIDSLVDRELLGAKIEFAGREQFDGKPAYRLHVTLMDGFEKEVFVDTETFLIVGDRRAVPIHAFGEQVRSENHIGDYKPVGGVLFPHLFREIEVATGKELNALTLREIVVNPAVDSSFFAPPQFQRTPLQAFLEDLFCERTDAASVMWSYRTFSFAHADLDTRAGIEFIGYQMLKMGDTQAAIKLLSANAEKYPDSASAEFSLGRAYKVSGNIQQAREHFQRAVQIDPKFKKATEELNSLK